jgi:membrane protein
MARAEGSNRQVVGIVHQIAVHHDRRDFGELFKAVMAALDRHGVLTDATAIAFRILFSLAFLSLTMLAFAGVVHLDWIWRHQLGPGVSHVVSRNFYQELQNSVDLVLTKRRFWWLSIGTVLTLWQVSSGVRALMTALDSIYEVKDRRPFWRRMATSFVLALVVCLALAAIAVLLFLFSTQPLIVTFAKFIVIAAVLIGLVAILLRYTVPAHLEFRWLTIGSALSILTWLITSWLFAWYVANFAYRAYQQAFGILSLLVVVMTYLYIGSVAFLVGAELDALLVTKARERASG